MALPSTQQHTDSSPEEGPFVLHNPVLLQDSLYAFPHDLLFPALSLHFVYLQLLQLKEKPAILSFCSSPAQHTDSCLSFFPFPFNTWYQHTSS